MAGLVLAAGEGRRLGGPKALVRYRGELLVERAVRTLREAGCVPVLTVLGARAEEVVAAADLSGSQVVVAADWAEGMGASLRTGLSRLSASAAGGVVVLLVDQPFVVPEAIRRLAAARPDGAAVASYHGEPRTPVLLQRAIWAEVADLAHGDVGARAWLRANPGRVRLVACEDVASASDVDTPADLAALREEET